MWTDQDLEQLERLSISREEAERQLALLRGPAPVVELDRPCRVGDGVLVISPEREQGLVALGEAAAAAGRLSRFVPASGAATRMFKELLDAQVEATEELVASMRRFPFADDLFASAEAAGGSISEWVSVGDHASIRRQLLELPGLGYARLPKGLLKFHDYPEGSRTAFEEHLVEAANTVRDAEGVCRLHFTVSVEHQELFEDLLESLRAPLRQRLGCEFEVAFSNQLPATDTLAADGDGQPFRREDGSLLLRPGGHGALIRNLASLGGDLVAIKNIDNVVPDAGKALVVRWKLILTGYLVELQERVFELARALRDRPDEVDVAEALGFVAVELQTPEASRLESAARDEQLDYLRARVDRPLRVCGVVLNEGEPGGGPFWVTDASGEATPQIVEGSQVNQGNEAQRSILASSTHFNPVDLACGLRDAWGRSYDLERYIDPGAVFVSKKSLEGRELEALERPGLWNGAMARWNTVFVEVPAATFAPVKTVFDLLRPAHQPVSPGGA